VQPPEDLLCAERLLAERRELALVLVIAAASIT